MTTRRERIEALIDEWAAKPGWTILPEWVFELQALWKVVDAEDHYMRGEGGINGELRAADALIAALDEYHGGQNPITTPTPMESMQGDSDGT